MERKKDLLLEGAGRDTSASWSRRDLVQACGYTNGVVVSFKYSIAGHAGGSTIEVR